MSSPVNGFTNNPKIVYITKRDLFQLSCLHSGQEIWPRCSRSDFNSVSPRLRWYLLKAPLKWDFLDIYLTTFFGARNLKNTSAMRVTFLSKMVKIEPKFRKRQKKLEKMFSVSEIIKSEVESINCLYWEENTCHQQWMCSQVILRLWISIRETFFNWTAFTVINKYGKGAAVQISTVFHHIYHGICQSVLWNGTF